MRGIWEALTCTLILGCSTGDGGGGDLEEQPLSSGLGGTFSQEPAGTGGGEAAPIGEAAGGDGVPLENVTKELCASRNEVLVGRTLLRRMTRSQYNNTLADLLSVAGDPAANLSPDEKVGPFVSNSRTPITDLLVEQLQESAIDVTGQLVGRENEIAGCDLSTAGCSDSFIEDFGRLAYRRPLDDSELSSYAALFSLGAEESTEFAFQLVIETMLQSPFFLYHVDVGPGSAVSASASPLTDYELASRLSYFLWDTMPDAELFELAESGLLNNDEALSGQVTRLLESPRAAETIASFVRQWLRVGNMSGVEKDPVRFAEFSPELRDAMVSELGSFSNLIIRDGDGLMSSLFLSTSSVMDEELFPIYGLDVPAGFGPGDVVDLPPAERVGLLTRAAFLTTQAHRDQTSPVHRGLAVRENLLCQILDPPPGNVSNVPPSPTEATTTRERFAQHNENVTCASCHRLMDSIGLGFEHYDPVGAYRAMDGGQAVDATGELVDVADDLAGPFDGALELSEKLAGSQDVADCMANQWFRFALGRVESSDDGCSLVSIREGFDGSNHNIRTLIEQIVLSDAFRSVRHLSAEEAKP